MSGAEHDWLRKFVHSLRKTKKGSNERLEAANLALSNESFADNNPCHVHWRGNFTAIGIGKPKNPDDYRKILEIWLNTADALHSFSENDHSIHVDEWLVLTYYRLFRSYNECQEQFTLKGLEGEKLDATLRQLALEKLNRMMDSKLPDFENWKKNNLNAEMPPSNEYHNMRHKDAIWQEHKDFEGLYNKEPKQYINLMNNEYDLYLSKRKSAPFDVSQLKGNTLITFFTDDLNFWATALLDRLEALAPVSFLSDDKKEREKKEKTYLKYWALERKKEEKPRQKFIEYKEHVQRFSMLMELLYDLKENVELRKKDRPLRLREYAELAHLHCIIAALPDEQKKWKGLLNHDDTMEPSWSLLRTNNNSRDFLELSAEKRYSKLITSNELGYTLAGVVRWLANRTNGFYIALSSNIQQGLLITDKTRRDEQSSSWGEKVVLQDGTTYYQFISAQMVSEIEELQKGLEEANIYFNKGNQNTIPIKIIPICFDALQINIPEILGTSLSEEWNRAWSGENEKVLIKLFSAMITFFLRNTKQRTEKQLTESICLPRLEKDEESKKQLMGALGLDENTELPIRLAKWIHGDEWGENFTVMYDANGITLYAIDLEDGLRRGDKLDVETNTYSVSPNGGFHAQRLYSPEIMNDFEDRVPKGAFNGLSAVGRLLAALVQKSERAGKEHAKDNIQTLNKIMQANLENKDNDITKDDLSVIWLSFFDWLLHWVTKKDDDEDAKFEEKSFHHHLNALVHLDK